MSALTFPVGTTWVFSVPPSWLVAGTVLEQHEDGYLTLGDCIYIESPNSGYATQTGLAYATTPKQLDDAIARCWPYPDGHVLRIDGVLMATPCKIAMTSLHRRAAAAAIKGAQ